MESPFGGGDIELERECMLVDSMGQEIQIGNGQGTSPTIASGPWFSSGALWSDAKRNTIEPADASPAGRNSVDRECWDQHTDPGFDRFMLKLKFAFDAAHVGASTTHIETADCES